MYGYFEGSVVARVRRVSSFSIQSLLADPNPASAANADAAQVYTSNRKLYEERVLDIVEKSMEAAMAEAEEDEEDSD